MAVSIGNYSIALSPSAQNALGLANLFRQLLIDAGLMTDWHDSWSVSNTRTGTTYMRVLKLVQDAQKTYGTTYVLFGFYFAGADSALKVFFSISTGGWDTSTHSPIGTQYLDYYAAPTTSYGYDGNAYTLFTWSTQVPDQTITRWTSGSTTILRSPNGMATMVLQSSIPSQPSWVDLNKVCVPPVFGILPGFGAGSNQWRGYQFRWMCSIRRMVFPGRAASGTSNTYFFSPVAASAYYFGGYLGAEDYNDPHGAGLSTWVGAIRLPWSDGAVLPGSSAPWSPLFTDINMAAPLNLKLPSDFCLATIPSPTKAGSYRGRIKVGDTEVWEIIRNQPTTNSYNTAVIMGRVV